MYLIDKTEVKSYKTYVLSFDAKTKKYLITGMKNNVKAILFVSAFKFVAIKELRKMNRRKYG